MFPRTTVALTLLLAPVLLHSALGQRIEDGQLGLDEKGKVTRQLRVQFYKGEVSADPSNPDHVLAIQIAAKEVIYPLVWDQDVALRLANPKETEFERETRLKKMWQAVENFDSRLTQLSSPKLRSRTTTTQHMFTKAAIEAATEVIDKGKPIAAVNAARILYLIPARRVNRGTLESEKDWSENVVPRLAEGNADRLAEVCLQLLESPRANDGMRYYLFRCLTDLLGVPSEKPLLKPDLVTKAIEAGIKTVEKKVVYPKATSRQEVEGYKALRLQAVRLVAQARTPVLPSKAQPALVLARVVGNDESIVPAPRIEERLEAAIGLTRLAPVQAKFPDLQMDYAAYLIGNFFVDFGEQFNKNVEAKTALARLRLWRIDAARLLEAIEVLRANSKNAYVAQVVQQSIPILNKIEQNVTTDQNVLDDWLRNNAPPNTTLFKNDPASTIKPIARKSDE